MRISYRAFLAPLAGAAFLLGSVHCSNDADDDSNAATSDTDAGTSTVVDSGSSTTDSGAATTDSGADTGTTSVDCSGATAHIDKIVCLTNTFLATLTADEKTAVNLAYSDNTDRTYWSNLPGVQRAGVKMGTLTTDQQTAALNMMAEVLTTAGYSDLTGIRAADDYLGSLQASGAGGGPGG